MSKISTEMQNNFSDIVPDIIKEKKFDKLVKEAEKTFKLIEKKNSDNPDVLEKIRKEYRDVIEARNKAQQKESIKWTELVAEEYKILKEEVKDLDKYWEADKANYSYNTGLFLTKDKNWKFISNWKKIPKKVIQKIKGLATGRIKYSSKDNDLPFLITIVLPIASLIIMAIKRFF